MPRGRYNQAIFYAKAISAQQDQTQSVPVHGSLPIRVADAPGRGIGNRRPSLDSYLAALDYERLPGAVSVHLTDSGFTGTAWANRFWNSSTPFAHAKFGGYLVTRLDGGHR